MAEEEKNTTKKAKKANTSDKEKKENVENTKKKKNNNSQKGNSKKIKNINELKNGDTIPKKANTLNADLTKAGVYGVLEQKNISAWLDLRNRAAHGKYGEYNQEQVELMYQGVLNFITTFK